MSKPQRIEINVEDLSKVVLSLTKNGYQCLVWQDGESMNVVVVEFCHPEYESRRFVLDDELEDYFSEEGTDR